MSFSSLKDSVVNKQDIFTAKKYLIEDEIDTLNRLFDTKRKKHETIQTTKKFLHYCSYKLVGRQQKPGSRNQRHTTKK